MTAFTGVFPAVPTPMTAAGGLNEDAFCKVLQFNIDAGAHGFWIAGGSGESVLLDDDENRRLAELAVQVCADRATTIMHVGAATTARAAALAAHAADTGCDAVCCVPPFFYGRSEPEIVEHYRVVGAAADLPLFVYNLPGCTGVDISPGLMRQIQEHVPQLAGLKHSSQIFGNIGVFAGMGLSCFTGSGALMLPALTQGACGCIDGWPGLAPERWVAIWQAYQKDDLAAAAQAQKAASAVMGLYDKGRNIGFHALLKHVLSRRLGLDCGHPRPPGLPLDEDQRAYVDTQAAALGLYD